MMRSVKGVKAMLLSSLQVIADQNCTRAEFLKERRTAKSMINEDRGRFRRSPS